MIDTYQVHTGRYSWLRYTEERITIDRTLCVGRRVSTMIRALLFTKIKRQNLFQMVFLNLPWLGIETIRRRYVVYWLDWIHHVACKGKIPRVRYHPIPSLIKAMHLSAGNTENGRLRQESKDYPQGADSISGPYPLPVNKLPILMDSLVQIWFSKTVPYIFTSDNKHGFAAAYGLLVAACTGTLWRFTALEYMAMALCQVYSKTVSISWHSWWVRCLSRDPFIQNQNTKASLRHSTLYLPIAFYVKRQNTSTSYRNYSATLNERASNDIIV